MPTYKKRPHFFTTDEGVAVRQLLIDMAADAAYKTDTSYSANISLYPDNLMPFVDKHMCYLRDHPSTDPVQYLANLRLMTRIR